jgi:hypothetical protein
MDINALRVFDAMRKIGLTEKDYREIEEEQARENNTGVYIQFAKKGLAVGVSHDTKHVIFIHRIPKAKSKSRILFKTLVRFTDLPDEIYTLHQIAEYRALDTEIKYEVEDLESLKDRICDRFADEWSKEFGESVYEYGYHSPSDEEKHKKQYKELKEKQLKALYWLFDLDFKGLKETREEIPTIIEVFSRKNRRVALIQEDEIRESNPYPYYNDRREYRYRYQSIKVKTFTPSMRQYNYVSPNREMFFSGYGREKQIWLDDNLIGKISKEELEVLVKRMEDNEEQRFKLLTADEYAKIGNLIRLEMLNAKREAEKREVREKLITKIKDNFGKEGKVVRQGITFTKDSIEYEGVKVECDKMGEYLEAMQTLNQQEPEFNRIFNNLVDWILEPSVRTDWRDEVVKFDKLEFVGRKEIIVDGIRVVMEKKGKNPYVNNFKVRGEDMGKIVKHSLHFKSQEEYDSYVRQASRMNLSIQKALSDGGIQFRLSFGQSDDNHLVGQRGGNIDIGIQLRREDNKNYAIIRRKKYRIKDINALFDLNKELSVSHIDRLQRTIRLFYKSLDGITPKEIGDIIRDGELKAAELARKIQEDYQKRIKRSESFVRHAIRLTNAQKTHKGWLVDGKSGMTYFVDNSAKVWTIQDGKQDQYLCIVDDEDSYSSDKVHLNDSIAKRLIMLSNDVKIAKELYETGDRVDKWFGLVSGVIEN